RIGQGQVREHGEAGDYAASGSSSTSMSGYQRLNMRLCRKNDRILLANGSCGGEGGKAGGPGLGPRALVEPGYEPIHVDGRGGGRVVEMGFLDTPIACAPEPEGPDPLREGAFDACSTLIHLPALPTGIPGPGRVQRLKLHLRMELHTPGG